MRNDSRFIPGEEIGVVSQWNFGAVDTAAMLLAEQVKAREDNTSRTQDETIRQEGYAQGFIQGQAQAMLEAQRQINAFTENQGRESASKLAKLIQEAQQRLVSVEQLAAKGVLEIACDLARQVLRHEISVNPNVLLPVVREALAALFADSKARVVRLNPLDLEVLQEILKAEFETLSVSLIADPTLTQGGCVVESAGTVVDATLEKRWSRAIAKLGLVSPWDEAGDAV